MMSICIALLAVCNVEQLITKSYPIRFYIEEKAIKDYSYLLTNSYDNAESWLDLMDETVRTGLAFPEEYYWGNYRSLCWKPTRRPDLHGRSSLNSDKRPIKTHHQYLMRKYGPAWSAANVRDLARFNFSEFRAFKIVSTNEKRREQFYQFLNQNC